MCVCVRVCACVCVYIHDKRYPTTFRVQSQCRILGVKWYDKIASVQSVKEQKLPYLPSLTADRRCSIFGHICRMSRNTRASQTLHLSAEVLTDNAPAADWKRLLGRPQRSWLQQLEDDTGLSVGAVGVSVSVSE